jgi:hypothetical protein
VVAGEPGPLRTDTGLRILPEHGLERLATADLVVVTSWDNDDESSAELQDALRAAVDRGARLLAHCTGAFAVAAGPVVTSAGTAAGIDASLYLLRQAFGGEVANSVARRMVVPPYRDGGQAQFIEQPVLPPGATAPTPAPPRMHGWSPSGCGWPSGCWRAAACRSTRWPGGPASARLPDCASTSSGNGACPRRSTDVPSAPEPIPLIHGFTAARRRKRESTR